MPAPNQGYAPAEPGTSQQAPDPAHFQAAHEPRMGAPQQAYAETDADIDEMLAEDEEEPRRGRRGLMIVAAIVAAIGLGGALAYTYRLVLGVDAPLIKPRFRAQQGQGEPPTAAFARRQALNRLGDDGGPPRSAAAAPAADPQRARQRRSTRARCGSFRSGVGVSPHPVAPSAPPDAANAPMVSVPGLMIENAGPPPQMPPSAARVQVPQQPPPARAVQQPPPMVASLPPAAMPPAHSAAPARKTPVALRRRSPCPRPRRRLPRPR
jgi:hypothetical protein